MNLNRVAAVLLTGTVAVAAAGTGVAIGSSTAAGVKACSTKTTHKLELIKSGKCPAGSTKVTLGAQGPRGKTGPQGPGAIEQETTSSDDRETIVSKNIAGIEVTANCTALGNPSITLSAVSPGQLLDFFGTETNNGTISHADEHQTSGSASVGGTNTTIDTGFDVIARAGTAPFAEIHVSAVQNGTECLVWEVAVPTKRAS